MMRGFDEAYEHSLAQPPFPTFTELEYWSERWCSRCVHGNDEYSTGCPLIMVAINDRTPAEWFEQPAGSPDRYHCVEYRPDDGPPPEPGVEPLPDPFGVEVSPRSERPVLVGGVCR